MKNISLALFLAAVPIAVAACEASSGWSDLHDVIERPPVTQHETVQVGKRYQVFCDFAIPLIEGYCDREVECGYLEDTQKARDACFDTFFGYIGQLRCFAPITLPDAHYDSCLEKLPSMDCSSSNLPLPEGCTFFE